MKRIFIIIFLGILFLPSFAQLQDVEVRKTMYERKVVSFKRMKSTGVGLTIGGAVLTVVGTALMATSDLSSDYDNEYDNGYRYGYDYENSNDEVGQFVLGMLSVVAGVATTAGGIVLWSIGSRKTKQYQQKLDMISFNVNPSTQQMVSLSYRF